MSDPLTSEERAFVTRMLQLLAGLSSSEALRLNGIIDRLCAEVSKWQRIRTPTHGTCCTCQACGLDYDSCRCDLDEVADEVKNLRARVEKLEAVAEAARSVYRAWDASWDCSYDPGHGMMDKPTSRLRTALAALDEEPKP